MERRELEDEAADMRRPPAEAAAGMHSFAVRLLGLLALILLPVQALADVKEKVAALAPAALVLVMDANGNELVAQNADQPFETRFYVDSKRVLYVRGGGDPFLVSEELALLAPKLIKPVGTKPLPGI